MLYVVQLRILPAYRLVLCRLLLGCTLCFAATAIAAEAVAVQQQNAASLTRIRQLLELPENKIDIGVATLLFAKDVYPDLDIQAYSRQIDELAARAKRFIGNKQDPNQRIRALSVFFFKVEGYSYDFSPGASKRDENHYLNSILDSKRGNCSTMPMLYLVIAQRLGYPIYPVAAPDHLFLRYVEGRGKYLNIEATNATANMPNDETYIKGLSIGEMALMKGSYLRTMTYRQYMGDLLATNATTTLYLRDNVDRAINYLETAVFLNPQFPDYYDMLKNAYLQKSRRVSDADLVAAFRERAQINLLMTEKLGFVRPN